MVTSMAYPETLNPVVTTIKASAELFLIYLVSPPDPPSMQQVQLARAGLTRFSFSWDALQSSKLQHSSGLRLRVYGCVDLMTAAQDRS